MKEIRYEIKSQLDMNQKVFDGFKNLVNVLIIKLGITDKIDQGDKNQIISHLINTYPRQKTKDRVYNQNFYFTIAYHKLLYILYKKNKHISMNQPRVDAMMNKGKDVFRNQFDDKSDMKQFMGFLQKKLMQLNLKFNKSYYLTIIKKLCQYLQNPQDAPYKRRDIIKQINQKSYYNGKKVPKSYIYRVFYILKKNFRNWKKEFQSEQRLFVA